MSDSHLLKVALPLEAWEAVADALDTYRYELEHSQRAVRVGRRLKGAEAQRRRLALVDEAARAVSEQTGAAER